MVRRKEFAYYVLFSILTCGIYGLYFRYQLNKEINQMTGPEPGQISPGVAIVLMIVTCGIYEFYWVYQMGLRIDRLSDANGIAREDSASGYLLWDLTSFFTLGITAWVAYYKMVKQFNRLADAYNSVWVPQQR